MMRNNAAGSVEQPSTSRTDADWLTEEQELTLRIAGRLAMKEWESVWHKLDKELDGVPETESERRHYNAFMQEVAAQKMEDEVRDRLRKGSQEILRRASIWGLMVVLVLGTTAFAMWDQILMLLRRDHIDHSSYSIHEGVPFVAKWPKWLPEGMEVILEEESEAHYYREYSGVGGAWLVYLLRPLAYGTELRIDTEGAITTKEIVQGYDAHLHTKDEESTLIWADHEEVFVLTGNLDYETLMRIAESCKAE